MAITASLVTAFFLFVRISSSAKDGKADVDLDRSGIGLECGIRPSFFGLEFAVSGYNILFAFPRGNGRDPGWRAEIFELRFDQEPGRYTSDCRYEVPRGFSIKQETRCSIDFKAKEMRTSSELQSALEANAQISGEGWGVSFSGSVAYQESLNEMRKEESIIIMSEAQCLYYYPDMDPTVPPPLSANFKVALRELQMLDRPEIYHDFFENYGTHFITSLDYGARYTKRYKMSSDAYNRASHRSISVEAQAQYEGIFSLGGGFGMTTEQQQAATEFRNDVEEHTSTVGALPDASGDPSKWAAKVQDTPAPVRIILESIDQLFTAKYFRGIEDIDYELIRERILSYKMSYCQQLKDRGLVPGCEALIDPKCEVPAQIPAGTVSCNYYSPADVYEIQNGERCTVTCDAGHVNIHPTVRCEVFGERATLDLQPNCGVWLSDNLRTFTEALEHCYGHGGRLAEVTSDQVRGSLYQYALARNDGERAVWIGGSDRRREGRWAWEWSQAPMRYTAWGRNNPSNSMGLSPQGQDCLALVFSYEGEFDDEYCFREYRYFCEKTPVPDCDVTDNESCFWFVNTPKTFQAAHLFCQSQGGTLADVTSDVIRDQLFIYGYRKARRDNGVWVGGTDMHTEGQWQWQGSGHLVTYDGWAPGKPDNAQGIFQDGQDCMLLSFKWHGQFDDDYCFRPYKFFCQTTITSATA